MVSVLQQQAEAMLQYHLVRYLPPTDRIDNRNYTMKNLTTKEYSLFESKSNISFLT
jgi:hypothetical protein